MDDVEFRVDPASDPADDDASRDDVVDLQPRSVPRWLIALGCVLALALVVAGLALRHHPGPATAAQQEPPTAAASPSPQLAPLPVSPVGPTVAHSGREIALDVALAGDVLYTLRYDLLTTSDARSGAVLGQVHVTGLDYFYGGPTMHVFLDPKTLTAWVLSAQVSPPQILEFNSVSLRERRTVLAPGTIYDAATLDGRLYLATTVGVVVVSPRTGTPTVVPGADVHVEAIAADPAHGRLLAVDAESPQHILAIVPGGAPAVRYPLARTISPALAVVGGQVWLAGYNEGGAVVWRLDPATLRPTASSPVAARAGPGAQLVAGESVLWVGSRGLGDRQQLWCVDARSGRIGGYWPGVSGAVSSRVGLTYAVRGGQVVGLPTTAQCAG